MPQVGPSLRRHTRIGCRKLRDWLARAAAKPSFRPTPTRKHPQVYDRGAYRSRNLIERMFCRIKDFRRIAKRYDMRTGTFLSAVLIAAILIWWLN